MSWHLSLHLLTTPVMAFRVALDPERSHLETLITAAKTLQSSQYSYILKFPGDVDLGNSIQPTAPSFQQPHKGGLRIPRRRGRCHLSCHPPPPQAGRDTRPSKSRVSGAERPPLPFWSPLCSTKPGPWGHARRLGGLGARGGCPAALHQAGHIPSLGLLAHLQDGASHRTERDPHGPHAQQRTHIHNIRKCKELQKEKDGQRNRKVGGGNTRREA